MFNRGKVMKLEQQVLTLNYKNGLLMSKRDSQRTHIKNLERKNKELKELFLSSGQINTGFKVVKKSLRPFKSGSKTGTVKGYQFHPHTENICYLFEEDDSYVEVRMCVTL